MPRRFHAATLQSSLEMLPTHLAEPDVTDAVSPQAGQLLADLEARQDEVLKELDALEARIEAVLNDWRTDAEAA